MNRVLATRKRSAAHAFPDAAPSWLPARFLAATLAVLLPIAATSTAPARAARGYELDSGAPSLTVSGEFPDGIAIDQASQDLYVAEVTTNIQSVATGQVEQLSSSGVPTASSPFGTGGEDRFTSVAVDPVTHDLYAYQTQASTPSGTFGTPQMDVFSSATGSLEASFSTAVSETAQLAADSAGLIYFPNTASGSIQVFNPSGALEETITCSACPGGAFIKPRGIAIDSAGDLYVADKAEGGRLVKLFPSSGGYVFDSVLQSGHGAFTVAVDPSSGDVLIGDSEEGDFHVVALDSSGTEFDDFGSELVGSTVFSSEKAGALAANAATHKLYLTDPGNDKVWVFDRVASILAPAGDATAATSLGQLEATLNATVNPGGHTLTDCHFEYIDDADFQAAGFTGAATAPCSWQPGGRVSAPVSARVTGLSPATKYDYQIVVASYGGSADGGADSLETLPRVPPSVTTKAALDATQSAATLSGEVNPHGGSVSDCHFEYGTSISYGTSVPCSSLPEPLTTSVPQSNRISGLSANTTYHYQLVVTSNAGTGNGGDIEFKTLPLPPTVSTGAASSVTQESATITGTINPNGDATSCHFEYGMTTSYGASAPCTTQPGGGEEPVIEQVGVSGLGAATTYHYRLVGSNAGDGASGPDRSFTTQALPTSQLPASSIIRPKPRRCPKGARKVKARGKARCACRRGFARRHAHGKVRCVRRSERKAGGHRRGRHA